jgi:hypothetical protein
MNKRSFLTWVFAGFLLSAVAAEPAGGDLFEWGFCIGLTIPIKSRAFETGTDYPFSGAIRYPEDVSAILEHSRLFRNFGLDREPLTGLAGVLKAGIDDGSDVFAGLAERPAVYSCITDFGEGAFGVTHSAGLNGLSRLIGRKSLSASDMWH